MKRNLKNSALAKTIVNKEIIEIESDTDTDEVGGGMLTLCVEENAPGDDTLAKNPNKSAVAKTIVKKEIKFESDIDEVVRRMLALCIKIDASRDDALAKSPKKSADAVVKTTVKEEVIEIESDTYTDEVGGRMLAPCGAENASGDDVLVKNPTMAKTIVKREIKIESSIDEVAGPLLALGEVNASGNDTLAKNPKKSEVAETIMKQEIIEIESDSDTDEVGGRMLALCGAENASGDDVLVKNPKNSAVAKTTVKREIKIESSIDEVGGPLLAPGEVNASGNDTLAKNPKKSEVAETIMKQEIIEIESDSDTDEVGGRMLAPCGTENASGDDVFVKNPKDSAVAKTIVKKEIKIESSIDDIGGPLLALGEVNASGNDTLAKNPTKSEVAETIVKQEIIEIESDSDTDEVGGRMLALCGAENDGLGKNPNKSAVTQTIVKKEIIEIESATDTDTDEVGGRMLALCGEVNASGDDALAKDGKTNRANMQIVCADHCDSGLVHDLEYKKYLTHFSEIGKLYMFDDNVRGSSPVRIMYNVDHETSDRSKGRAVIIEKSRAGRKAKSPTISSVSKRLKTENGRADSNSILRTGLRIKETQQKKGDGRRGRKSSVAKKSIELKPTSYARGDTKQKNGDAARGRKISVANNTIELKPTSYVRNFQEKNGNVPRGRKISLAKKDIILKHSRNDESQKILRASKRLKTEIGRSDHNLISKSIPVVNTKDTQRRKREALQQRKIPVSKHNNESKSRGHVRGELFHGFLPPRKENELSSMDKSYSYYVAYLRTSITIVQSDRQVKPVKVKDGARLSDPDIIAVSDYPFRDGGKSPFEATKDGRVIDLEDGTEPDDIFNSSFSKKLIEILRNPYDEKEYLRLYHEASLKRPLTRSRQLRDGREIEYNVEDQLAPSYLEKYTDFNKKYHRYQKDLPRALNLLRGFFFYLENIVLEGAFKPWLHEQRLTNLLVDARECIDIVGNK
ncbi:hypothetical protein CARUB_v10019729mg [Capsella rubella]|uniref:Uncharacterized protein n=1 Tax=Capsella rubella TaxID=81985 RepID=R0HUT2_9BRAS|nr:uncharacterized protein LOC17895434 [Capsella rubella]EOA33584.1 hypothetical protein CARUB_v10019729mg [Capsella rubella]